MSTLTHTDHPAPAANRGRTRGGARLIDLLWLTWRQHRAVIIASLTLGAVLIGAILFLAARITTINHECGNTACPGGSAQAASLTGAFGLSELSNYLSIVVMFLPLLAGVFLGIPVLAREHEQRTLLLAWSQDIAPQRWLWTKLALLGALTAAVGAAVSAGAGHLADVISIATGHSLFYGSVFLVTGMVPLAQSVVWFIAGVALGAACRRTLRAIFAALVAYIGLYFVVQWRYPTFMTPLTALVPITGDGQGLSSRLGTNILTINQNAIYDASGHAVSQATVQSLCPSGPGGLNTNNQCLAQHHFKTLLSYQPGARIPDFHLILIGGYLGLGLIAAVAVWWLVRRTSISAG
jgi:ABC-type transport system involved in multi-copper enzyme maturation permease subunit